MRGEQALSRVEDSIARVGTFGPVILRRSRGYAPGAVATIPIGPPILAAGADLKNSITLVVNGQAMMSQYIGDLDQYQAFQAFREPDHEPHARWPGDAPFRSRLDDHKF